MSLTLAQMKASAVVGVSTYYRDQGDDAIAPGRLKPPAQFASWAEFESLSNGYTADAQICHVREGNAVHILVNDQALGVRTSGRDGRKWVPGGQIHIGIFGGGAPYASKAAAEAGTGDVAVAVRAALAFMIARGTPDRVVFDAGWYRWNSRAVIQQDGAGIAGASQFGTRFIGTSTSGDLKMLQMSRDNPRLSDIEFTASTARKALGFTAGACALFFEPEDVPDNTDLRVRNVDLRNVRITDQPGHAMICSGPAFTGTFTMPWISGNLGDAIVVDHGFTSGRVNVDTDFSPGLLTVTGGEITHNGGYALRGGDAAGAIDEAGTVTRVVVNNVEIGRNGTNAAVRKAGLPATQIYYNGSNLSFEDCVFAADAAANMTVAYLLGRSMSFKGCRVIGHLHVAYISSVDEVLTQDIEFDRINIINPAEGATMSVGIIVKKEAGQVNNPRGIKPGSYAGSVTQWIATDGVSIPAGGADQLEELHYGPLYRTIRKPALQTAGPSQITLEADDHLKFAMRANVVTMFRFVVQFSATTSNGDVRFAVRGPAGASILFGVPGSVKVDAAQAIIEQVMQDETSQIMIGATTSRRMITIEGEVVNGATAGQVSLQFAQATTDATQVVTIHVGSRVEYWEAQS